MNLLKYEFITVPVPVPVPVEHLLIVCYRVPVTKP
jgi:hypothetical protein